jgi:hypothetical protein
MDDLDEDACPICRLLREFQGQCLRELDARTVKGLCSFHLWWVSAVTDLGTASVVFLKLLEESRGASANKDCDICAWVAEEEAEKLQQFSSKLSEPRFREWLRKSGAFCLPHSRKLLDSTPKELHQEILSAMLRREAELERRLREQLQRAKARLPVHAGILGRVAEFLMAQRGLGKDS